MTRMLIDGRPDRQTGNLEGPHPYTRLHKHRMAMRSDAAQCPPPINRVGGTRGMTRTNPPTYLPVIFLKSSVSYSKTAVTAITSHPRSIRKTKTGTEAGARPPDRRSSALPVRFPSPASPRIYVHGPAHRDLCHTPPFGVRAGNIMSFIQKSGKRT